MKQNVGVLTQTVCSYHFNTLIETKKTHLLVKKNYLRENAMQKMVIIVFHIHKHLMQNVTDKNTKIGIFPNKIHYLHH